MPIKIENFGNFNGNETKLITITLDSGFSASFTQYAAAIVGIYAPDRNGDFADVVQGYDDVQGYANGGSSQGAVVGRFANRIAKGNLVIDGEHFQLPINCGVHTLHGGGIGFQNAVWDIDNISENSVTFSFVSVDGDANFPGKLTTTVKYTVENDFVRIDYKAKATKKTAVNLTNHAYFNLSGKHDKLINEHILLISANKVTAVDIDNVPTGEYFDVKNTIFDFNEPKKIGINSYDHNFVLNGFKSLDNKNIFFASSLLEPKSGRIMHCFTNKPGLQIYTANGLSEIGKNGLFMPKRSSICLETQYFPDSPNHANFPFEFLDPNLEYDFTTIYRFEVGDSL